MIEVNTERDKELWKLAKKRVGFKRHLTTYIIVNAFLWLLWFYTDHKDEYSGLPWPIFPMVGWGIGLMFNFLNAYVFIKNAAIEKEYQKLKAK